jgi:hypothetical protein
VKQKVLTIAIPAVLVVAVSAAFFLSGRQGRNAGTAGGQLPAAATGEAFTAMMQELSTDLSAWEKLSVIDKVRAVDAVMRLFTMQSQVTFTKPPEFYAASIDSAVTSEKMRHLPLDQVLMIIAVMEYDFTQEGKDKDQLAREILGDAMYEQNKARIAAQTQEQAGGASL